nr:malto-oligosyltrehalose synthase [Legionella jordanis]
MHTPLATYRLQLNKQFNFEAVLALLPYFKQLGISDLYLSPILQAQPGSTHGYDVADFKKISDDLGGRQAFENLAKAAKQDGLSLCLDIVPNHMAATEHNPYWRDVLANGQSSKFSYLFDIRWDKSEQGKLRYRRFFDINELVCLNAEREDVFFETHGLILELIEQDLIQGLRVDHIDGLRKPKEYLERLRQAIGKPFFIVVEKILGYDETLPPSWPLAGTTGYEFLNQVNKLYVFDGNLPKLISIHDNFSGNTKTFHEIKEESLQLVISNLFEFEAKNLIAALDKLLSTYPTEDIRQFFLTFSQKMPIYRLYNDAALIYYQEKIIHQIIKHIPLRYENLSLLFQDLLLKFFPEDFKDKQKHWQSWRSSWEVFSGPVMAKGYEDTACYRYNVLLSLNEVGSSPEYYYSAGSLKHFHDANETRVKHWPHTMNASSTHDSKRSEDLRARLNALSEWAEDWDHLLGTLEQLNLHKKTNLLNQEAPDQSDEMLLYQTLLGVWPLRQDLGELQQRLNVFLNKALRERKQHTSWSAPNDQYEKACLFFTKALLDDDGFIKTLLPLQEKLAFYGMLNSLSQLILKSTAPGTPDFYQGNEVWRFDLVDPDNRQAIDFKVFKNLFSDEPLHKLLNHWKDGEIKFNLTHRLLWLRHQFKDIFLRGDYQPLFAVGPLAQHIIAFSRKFKEQTLIVVTTRWFSQLIACNESWNPRCFTSEMITLPEAQCYKPLLGEKSMEFKGVNHSIQHLLSELPFTVLMSSSGE